MRTTNRTDTDLARDTVALILAGGNGTRLGELTRWQCKPAIVFAGHFRNIDFTLSNCVNSGVRRVAVLTQYKSQSLITHICGGWNFLARPLGEFVDVWPAQQRLHSSWYAGTADAVHQNLDLLLAQRSRYTLVLAGDHVYKMDYRKLLERHAQTGADVTVACVPVPVEDSGAFGVLGVDERQRVCSFIEKPQPSSLGMSSLKTVLASLDDSSVAVPERSVVLVADDGHRTVYTDLFPLIKRFQIPVTLFIYPSAISNANYAMTWEQLAEMKASGLVDIQGHTFWHPNFKIEKKRLAPAAYEKFTQEQLVKSKAVLEQKLGGKVDLLAWPFGIYDPELMSWAQAAGYVAAFSIDRRPVTRTENVMSLPRSIVTDADRGARFEALLMPPKLATSK